MNSELVRHFDEVAPRYAEGTVHAFFKSWEIRQVEKQLPDLQGLRVLEFACGRGHYTEVLSRRGPSALLALDASAQMIAHARPCQAHYIHENIDRLSTAMSFDWIFCFGGLEFLPLPQKTFRHLTSLSYPETRLMILAPPPSFMGRLYRRSHRRHGLKIHLFSSEELIQLASATGWRHRSQNSLHPYARLHVFERSP